MSSTTLLIAWAPGELRGIVMAAGIAVDLRIERDISASLIDAPFVGRIDRLVPALPAAFVDIGLARPAFLPLRRRLRTPLHEGAAVAVSVAKDARDPKPPELRMMADQRPAQAPGMIPRRLDPEGPAITRLLASLAEVPFDEMIVNDATALREARAYLAQSRPDLIPSCRLEAGSGLFERHGLGDVFELAVSTTVALETGGIMTLEPSAAGLMVDIDLAAGAGGGSTAEQAILATNLAAAAALARHLRLRGIGGAIIVDFISMRSKEDRQRIWDCLAGAVASDPSPVELHGWTRLGHFELTRRRRRASIGEIVCGSGHPSPTPISLALEALARICFAAPRPGPITLRVTPSIADALSGPLHATLDLAAARSGRRVTVERRDDQERAIADIDGI